MNRNEYGTQQNRTRAGAGTPRGNAPAARPPVGAASAGAARRAAGGTSAGASGRAAGGTPARAAGRQGGSVPGRTAGHAAAEKKKEPGWVRESLSSLLTILFYALFIAFAWFCVYRKSLDFLTGADTGIPGNPEIIPAKLVEPAIRAVVQALIYLTVYAFFFASPEIGLGHAGGRLTRQDLRGEGLLRRRYWWTIPWWLQMAFLFLFSYHIRMQVIDLIGHDTIQVMDFERVFYVSLQDAPVFADVQGINFYRAFPNWALHVKLLHLLNVNFGGDPMTGILCNAVVSSLSVALLYLVVYFATNKDAFAVIAALIFSCWPFYLYYMILLTPDFNFVFLCLLSLLFIVVSYRFVKALWLKCCLYGAAGVLLALAGFFKSIDKILIIALFISAVVSAIALGSFRKKRAAALLLSALVFFAAWAGTGKLVYHELEQYVGGNVNTNVAPYFMNVGMSVDSDGQWSQEVLDEYLGAVKETDYDFKEVNARMNQRLKERIEEVKKRMEEDGAAVPAGETTGAAQGAETEGEKTQTAQDDGAGEKKLSAKWAFFDTKLQKAWANNEGIRFIMQTINPKNPLYDMEFYETYYAQIQAYQVVVAFLTALGALIALVVRERRIVFVSALTIFGFALLLLISEVQPRYKAVIFPFLSVVAAYGVYGVVRPVQLALTAGLGLIFSRGDKKSPGRRR